MQTDNTAKPQNSDSNNTSANNNPAPNNSSSDAKSSENPKSTPDAKKLISRVVDRINSAENILVTLSKNPSVDDLSAALGLSMVLNDLGKHTTAIYSGATPNALEFLQPEGTFEKDTNSLQDFIIALNKEKADHLRYKIDGDFVKVYITPYRAKITEDDLEFSHGDYNVDLIIALNVQSGEDLDAALFEYRRILHDATAVNITTGEPGRFAEIEWSDHGVSSVSEMTAQLIEQLGVEAISQEVATALLTGIIAATDRFSNDHTHPNTMTIASRLMAAGADQQLIATNVEKVGNVETPEPEPAEEETVIDGIPELKPEAEINLQDKKTVESSADDHKLEPISPVAAPEPEPEPTPAPESESTPTPAPEPISPPRPPLETNPALAAAPTLPPIPEPAALPSLQYNEAPAPEVATPAPSPTPEPTSEPEAEPDAPKDYAKMMAEELAEPLPIELEQIQQNQVVAPVDNVNPQPELDQMIQPVAPQSASEPLQAPAPSDVAPVPDFAETQLPPPPAPPVDLSTPSFPLPPTDMSQTTPVPIPESSAAPESLSEQPPVAPASESPQPTPNSTPVAEAPVSPAPPTDPGAFQIPTLPQQ